MSDHHEHLWYDLFSRGARDWLRHNAKIRSSVREQLPRLVAEADILSTDANRKVRMPVRFLEHYRFKLSQDQEQSGVGQGKVAPGDTLGSPAPQPGKSDDSGGGNDQGGVEFVVEMKVDEIVDWIWEELKLPELEPRASSVLQGEDWSREGWDKRGARARLDRRRTMKEAIKRRAVQPAPAPPFSNEDLRFRQLRKRMRPSTQAVVLFGLDASSSMGERERMLAKTFFFWALQGIRRRYSQLETAFIGHTVEAWEFNEEQFFQVSGQGGTVASTCFNKALEIIEQRYPPAQYNVYFFYASDGENFQDDHDRAVESLRRIAELANFSGYVEVATPSPMQRCLETSRVFDEAIPDAGHGARFSLFQQEDVWEAIRAFFGAQPQAA
ncbi:MAG TPA: DUF444 family protein [Candidatus Macondimonas sp.]|nr:DUF444 family protein [Candidatus Macondimonas sp.]